MESTEDILDLPVSSWPQGLRELPHPPSRLRIRGTLPQPHPFFLACVGSRKASAYGMHTVRYFIEGLKGLPVSIVSGLALGIDACAHREALRVGLHSLAFPGSGLSEKALYPRTHRELARALVEQGGALISEYDDTFKGAPWAFPERNRLMAGCADVVLVIEASRKSGTLITARLALEYGKTVCAVPGSIFDEQSEGTHYLIREGAIPVRTHDELLDVLGFVAPEQVTLFDPSHLPAAEKILYHSISQGIHTDEELVEKSGMPAHIALSALTSLEIRGVIEKTLGEYRIKK